MLTTVGLPAALPALPALRASTRQAARTTSKIHYSVMSLFHLKSLRDFLLSGQCLNSTPWTRRPHRILPASISDPSPPSRSRISHVHCLTTQGSPHSHALYTHLLPLPVCSPPLISPGPTLPHSSKGSTDLGGGGKHVLCSRHLPLRSQQLPQDCNFPLLPAPGPRTVRQKASRSHPFVPHLIKCTEKKCIPILSFRGGSDKTSDHLNSVRERNTHRRSTDVRACKCHS